MTSENKNGHSTTEACRIHAFKTKLDKMETALSRIVTELQRSERKCEMLETKNITQGRLIQHLNEQLQALLSNTPSQFRYGDSIPMRRLCGSN